MTRENNSTELQKKNEVEYKISLKESFKSFEFLEALRKDHGAAYDLFDQLTDEEKVACGHKLSKSNNEFICPLFVALRGSFTKVLIAKLMIVTPPDILVQNGIPTVLFYLFERKNRRDLAGQDDILALILKYLKKYKLNFELLAILCTAFEKGSSEAAHRLLCEYYDDICLGHYPLLLNAASSSNQLQCIQTLVRWGAKLEQRHTQSFIIKLNKPNKDVSPGEAKAMIEMVDLFKKNDLKFPFDDCLFTSGNHKIKKEIIKKILTKISYPDWLLLGDKIFAHPLSCLQTTLIKLYFSGIPQYKFTHPEKFTDLAATAIRNKNSIIHALIKKGLHLEQRITKIKGETTPEFENSLNHFVAFYSSDNKLIKKLKKSDDINGFHRTPAHYAALSFSSILKFKKGRMQFARIANTWSEDFEIDFRWSLFFVDTQQTGSLETFKLTNSSHWHTPDITNSTPLDCAAMHAHGENGRAILNFANSAISQTVTEIFKVKSGSSYRLPLELIEIIKQYLIYDRHPDEVAIAWARTLISKENLFGDVLQERIIEPLKKYCSEEYQLTHYDQAMKGIRIAQQLFTLLTLWDFDFFGLTPTEKDYFIQDIEQGYLLKRGSPPPLIFHSPLDTQYDNLPSEQDNYFSSSLEFYQSQALQDEKKTSVSSVSNPFTLFSSSAETLTFNPRFSQKSKKRGRFDDDENHRSQLWKERRESLVQSLQEIWQSGSRKKYELEEHLLPCISKIEKARNEQEMEKIVTDMQDIFLKENSDFKDVFERHGLSVRLAEILGIKNPQNSQYSTNFF